jgi:hypothetical protein
MFWNRKRAMLSLAWLLSLAVANYVGGVVGYSQGSRTQICLSAGDAVGTVSVLRQLRDGRTADAINSLETELDAQIAANVFGRHAYHSPYNLFIRFVFGERPLQSNALGLSTVLKYREQYPPVSGDTQNARLMKALAAYRNAPNPDSPDPRRRTRIQGGA